MNYINAMKQACEIVGGFVVLTALWDIARYTTGKSKPTWLNPLTLLIMWFTYFVLYYFFK